MNIIGIVTLIVAVIAAVGIFYFHKQDADDLAQICIWVFVVAALMGLVLVFLPGILHPTAGTIIFIK
ncbi:MULTISPECIES: hypothetical protein [Lactobacillaceae]|uniref:hypothetical protein n=1 Tax=Lactobacillaceae TaxID=33958 RepID=UPI0021A3737B|nr:MULTISPECIES: hypothetical protein [Lactobacillaceae]MCT3316943.1 hypothetical protein [Lacticaseibacillus paracasei]UZM84294.1 hypothetical protein OP869_15260 [Lactiplantibacillus argentoratensis]